VIYTNTELLNNLETYYFKTGKIPIAKSCNNSNDMPSYSTYARRFGSFSVAINLTQIPELIRQQKVDKTISKINIIKEISKTNLPYSKRKINIKDYIIYRLSNPFEDRDLVAKHFNISHITITNLNKDLDISLKGNTFYFQFLKKYIPNIKFCERCEDYFDTIEHFDLHHRCCRLYSIELALKRRNNTVTLSTKEIENILYRFNYQCNICGITQEQHLEKYNKRLEIDHIIAIANGGTNAIENLQILYRSCNARKGKS